MIVTYGNAKVIEILGGNWLPSLRRVYHGRVVVYLVNASEADVAAVRAVDGRGTLEVVALACQPKTEVATIITAWAERLSGERAGEPVLIYDGGDVTFQEPVGSLEAEVADAGGVRCMLEPRCVGDSPSTMRALIQILGVEAGKVIDAIAMRPLLNTALIAGQACELAALWREMLEMCGGRMTEWGWNWCADQAWMNYVAYKKPGAVSVLAPAWCYDLRFYRNSVDQGGRYVDGLGRTIRVVHAGGHQYVRKPWNPNPA